MDLDLRDDLDRCLGDGPAHRPLDETLDAGHRALRRRRQQWVAGSAAALAVVTGVGLWQAQPAPRTERPPVATPAEPDAGPADGRTLWRDVDPIPQFEVRKNQVFYDADGVLVVRPGTTVEARTDDPLPVHGVDRSVALVTRDGDRTYWSYAWWRDISDRASSSSIRPEEARGGTFDDWVAAEAALVAPVDAGFEYVELTADGTLRPLDGVEVLEQTGGPTVAALIAVGGARLCAFARSVDSSGPEYAYLNAVQYGPGLAGCTAHLGSWG